jgi:hypothetical protein
VADYDYRRMVSVGSRLMHGSGIRGRGVARPGIGRGCFQIMADPLLLELEIGIVRYLDGVCKKSSIQKE